MPDPKPTRRFRLRFTLKQLFLAVALIGVGLGVWTWLPRKEVVVRAPRAEDQLIGGHKSWVNRRNAAVVTGKFMKGTSLTARTYLVKAGLVKNGETHFARSHLEERAITTVGLGLDDELVPGRPANSHFFFAFEKRRTMLWDFLSISRPIEHNITPVAKQTLLGTVRPGRPYIVYVEGDRQIVVDDSMSVEEFAKANPGNYLVVTVEVR